MNGDNACPARPSGLHPKLVNNAQCRLDFADRVHRHLIAPGSALTSGSMIARWQKWQAMLDKLIVVESCRWGDCRRDVHNYQTGSYVLYTRENEWLAENTRMTGLPNEIFPANPNGYFPTRAGLLQTQLQTAGLYPATAAAEFRQDTTSGTIVGTSQIAAGSAIAMNRPGGADVIYYTRDGNDPHFFYTPTAGAGATSIAATALTYSAPITVSATTTIKSRILNGGVWSAVNEAIFTVGVARSSVRISEIMYNPPGGKGYEFVELQNTGTRPLDLGGWSFDGIDFYFPLGTILGAGDRLVLGNNDGSVGLFTARYPGVVPAGYFGGSLDNNGERIALKDADGRTVDSVTYDDVLPWPTSPDGGGTSLELIDVNGDPDSYANWKASDVVKGTPGQANSVPPVSAVLLNEVLAVNTGGVLVSGQPLG